MFKFGGKKAISPELKCKIDLLVPNSEIDVSFSVSSTGNDVLSEINKQIELADKDYYGLRVAGQIDWVDLTKSVYKQTKPYQNVRLELRFKYYPAEPALLANESTRYRLYSQLRLDMLEGRLKGDDQDTLAYLIACVLQCELGDYSPDDKSMANDNNYVSEFKFVPNQSEELEWAAIKLHQSEDFLGLSPTEAELNFIKKAHQLDTYGIDPYPVKDGNSQTHFLIGVNYLGISTFQDSKKTNQFSWNEIERITIDNKLVLIYCKKIPKEKQHQEQHQDGTLKSIGTKSRQLFGFRSPTQSHAYNFWKSATEQRFFFTLEYTPDLPIVTNSGGLFKRNHKLKYTGRVEKDIIRESSSDGNGNGKSVKRSQSLVIKSLTDGPRWQGFQNQDQQNQQGNNLPGSCMNIAANKTMPATCFREEDEHEESPKTSLLQDDATNNTTSNNTNFGLSKDGRGSLRDSQNSGGTVLAPSRKRDSSSGLSQNSSINRGREGAASVKRKDRSKFYTCSDQPTNDFMKSTIFVVSIIVVFVLAILLVDETNRPSSVNLLLKRINLEQVSRTLRQNYYLPLKAAFLASSVRLAAPFQ